MKAKICREPNCNALIPQADIYCSKHKREPRVPFANAIRSNEGLYNTSQWKKLKKEVLKNQPYCNICGISKNEAVLECHHIIAPRGNIINLRKKCPEEGR